MTPDQKPEWFQIADADNAASTRKISKGLPIMALVAVAAIIGVGAVVAQPQEQTPANATETVAPVVVDPTQTSAKNESVAPAASVPSASKAPVTPGVANPLGKKPKNGEHEGREDGEHEGGGEDD